MDKQIPVLLFIVIAAVGALAVGGILSTGMFQESTNQSVTPGGPETPTPGPQQANQSQYSYNDGLLRYDTEYGETQYSQIGSYQRHNSNGGGLSYQLDTVQLERYSYRVDEPQRPSRSFTPGVYTSDFNRDGQQDLLLLQNWTVRLLERTPQGELEETPSESTVRDTLMYHGATPTSAVFADYTGDGYDDLVIAGEDSQLITFANRNGSFVPDSRSRLSTQFTHPRSLTTNDINGDGCLDIFVADSGDWAASQPTAEGEKAVGGSQNKLYYGNCNGSFSEASLPEAPSEWSMGATMTDISGNGQPDIVVSNYYGPPTVYLNTEDGLEYHSFTGASDDSGSYPAQYGLTVTQPQGADRPTVLIAAPYADSQHKDALENPPPGNNTEGAFGFRVGDAGSLVAVDAGAIQKGGSPMGLSTGDINNDRQPEVVQASGTHYNQDFASDISESALGDSDVLQRVYDTGGALYYLPDGSQELSESSQWATNNSRFRMDRASNVRSGILADMDRSGTVDIIYGSIQDERDSPIAYQYYDNTGNIDQAVQIRVRPANGTTAIGSTVTVTADGDSTTHVVRPETGHLSQGSRVIHAGIGESQSATVTVEYPNGNEVTAFVQRPSYVEIGPSGVERSMPLPAWTG